MGWPVGTRLSLARDLIGEAMSRDRPLVLSDVAAETGLTEAKRAELLAAGVRSWAVIPLVAVGGWIGVLSVAASDPGAITEHNLQPYLTLAGQVALSIERSNLFKQTQEALEETSMLYRVSRAIGSAASIREVADALIRSVSGSDFDRGLVLIRRQASDQLEVVTGWDRSGREVEVGALIDVSQVVPEPVIYPVSDGELARDGDWRHVIGMEGLALASVPIFFRSRLQGALLLAQRSPLDHPSGESRPTDQLSEEALQPFVTLAAQAAVAIENRRLFEETRRVAEEEAMLNEMLRNMATALDVWAVIHTVQDSLSQLVPFDRMNVALANEEMSTLEVFHVGGDAEHHPPSEGQVAPLKETLIGQAIESGDTVVFDLTDQSLRGLEVEPLRQAGLQSIVILPLVYGRNVLGSLNLGHHHHDAYTTSDLPLLERVAQLMAVALENARLFDQVSQRALQLQTAAEISQSTTSILSLDQLLPQAVELIRERYDLYYAGVFLIDEAPRSRDETGEWAVLRAGTGEAGRLQLEQGHRLKVGGESMVGWCVSNAQARIASDVTSASSLPAPQVQPALTASPGAGQAAEPGEEATRFDNPFLPDTRSEMALPLISRGETMGAISVQSTQPVAFSREDITTLQTMADQLANAIQNARFYDELQTAYARTREERDRLQSLHDTVVEIEQATTPEHKLELVVNGLQKVGYGRVVLTLRDAQMYATYMVTAGMSEEEETQLRESMESPDVWRQRMSGEFDRFRIERCYYVPWSHPDAPALMGKAPPDRQAPEPGALDADRWHPNDLLYVPLYDSASQLIGIVSLDEPTDGRRPTPDSLRIVGLFAQEAALSIENTRLLQQAQERAHREALIREITDKIRGSIDLEGILQTTVTEVARALGTSHGAIRLGTPEHLQSPSREKSEDGRESRPTSSPPPPSSSPAEDLADIPYPAGTEHSASTEHSATTGHSASTGHPASAEPHQPGQVSAPPPEGAGKGGQEL
jgi:GAF domain-containing protein